MVYTILSRDAHVAPSEFSSKPVFSLLEMEAPAPAVFLF